MAAQRTPLKIIVIAILSVVVGMMIPNRWRVGNEPRVKNLPENARLIESTDGKALFEAYCASCHGPGGKGYGPAAAVLQKSIPDLTHISQMNGGAFPEDLVRKIVSGDEPIAAHGSRDMPTWGPIFRQLSWDQQLDQLCITNLTKYLESLQQK